MGSFHPHGDAALYETLVRMAQSFSLRYPLVDGSGNFGSLDGDSAAAMRYTECRLARIADEMLSEIERTTVPFRPNYDGTKTEPVVLPARIPNLLVNGATGIAVGMATNIPPHNLAEICTALTKLLDNEDLSSAQLCRWVKGPDFPTGGQILNSPEEIKNIYKTGSGSIRLRGTWDVGPETRSTKTIYVESVPYTVNKAQLVERIADIVISRKLPQLVDVKDLSTEDVRIALEMKKDADEKMIMSYLFKHTPLQINFAVNLTCLIPTENPELGRPERLDLKSIPLALPALPPRGRHQAARARARRAQEAHPHPRRLRNRLRRARRDHQDHPQVGRQGGCRRQDHEALLARRRPDRRDPRVEDLPPRAPRDPDHSQRARGEAQARAADRRAPQGRRQPLEGGQERARGDSARPTAIRNTTSAARRSRATPASPSTPPTTSSSTKTTSSSCRATAG